MSEYCIIDDAEKIVEELQELIARSEVYLEDMTEEADKQETEIEDLKAKIEILEDQLDTACEALDEEKTNVRLPDWRLADDPFKVWHEQYVEGPCRTY